MPTETAGVCPILIARNITIAKTKYFNDVSNKEILLIPFILPFKFIMIVDVLF